MAMKRDGESQPNPIVSWADVPRSSGRAFYYRLQKLLVEAGFDRLSRTAARVTTAADGGVFDLAPVARLS